MTIGEIKDLTDVPKLKEIEKEIDDYLNLK